MTREKFIRRILIWTFAAFFVIAITFLSIRIGVVMSEERDRKPATTTTSLNVLNWTSYIPREVIRGFEQEYNVKVNYGTYSSNEELLAKLTASPAGTYDVVFPSDYLVSILSERGDLQKLDLSQISNLKNIDEKFLHQPYDDGNVFSLPFLLATTVILYNKDKTGEIKSYQDLARTELKNDLVLLDDERIIIGATLLATGHDMNDVFSGALADASRYYNELRPNIKAYDSDSPKTFFMTDEVAAGLIWNAEAILAQEENPALVSVYPDEGFALSMDNYVIMKGSRNTAAAYAFINYLMRDDVARTIVESYPYISPIKNASNINESEIEMIFSKGSYVKNLSKDETKRLDHLWAEYK